MKTKRTLKSDNITVSIPKDKAAGGAAGVLVGSLLGGPVAVIVGGVVGAMAASNRVKLRKAVASGVAAVKRGNIGTRVKNAASAAGQRVAGAFKKLKSRFAGEEAKPAPKPRAANRRKPAKRAKR